MEAYSTWCPYAPYMPSAAPSAQIPKGDYNTVEQSPVPAAHRDYSPDSTMPPAPRHGGLYSGLPSNNPWNSIPVTATMTNMIQNNLRSANPPPGATEQYVGTERLGNSYAPMPGTYWYNPEGQHGQFNIKVRKQCEARAFGADGNPVEKQQTY